LKSDIAYLRHIHDYFGVNWSLVWASTQGSMKIFGDRIRLILARLDKQSDLPL